MHGLGITGNFLIWSFWRAMISKNMAIPVVWPRGWPENTQGRGQSFDIDKRAQVRDRVFRHFGIHSEAIDRREVSVADAGSSG
jgi:hypothetical protein